MKKTNLFFIIFTLTFFSVFSQKPQNDQISITGKIIDSNTKEPLEYATVILNNQETKQLSGGITDENGNFNIKINTGTYDISFEFISFKTIKISNKIINSSINFGTIKLSEDADKVKEWSGDERTWKDVYSQKPVEYLEAISKGLDPVWDSELKKYTYDDPNSVSNSTNTTTLGSTDPQANDPQSEDLPF